MSGPPKVRSMNVADLETRPVLGPTGNKARSLTVRESALKPLRKVERPPIILPCAKDSTMVETKSPPPVAIASPPPPSSPRASSILRRHEQLLQLNLSLNASCSSDASSDSMYSRASTGRISQTNIRIRRKQCRSKLIKVVPDSVSVSPVMLGDKKRCAWVTSNTDPCYATFHDEEWGVPVHDDKKLFELLVLSGALAELTWPTILGKRHIFREVFVDFDPAEVAKLNEKKMIAPGSIASSLLSEAKLRAIIENARQIPKIIQEFGSLDKYIWGFVNQKPIVSRFRHQRHVPVKTPKADVISKDLVRRGFRSVGPTVVYTFMQAAGLSNDHLLSCYRFDECMAAGQGVVDDGKDSKVEENKSEVEVEVEVEISKAVSDLNM